MARRNIPSILRLAVIALALLVGDAAYSGPPPPPSPESKQLEQTKAEEVKPQASKEERGSRTSPVIVEVLPAKGADEAARQQREYEHEKSSSDRLIAGATVGLAAVTVALAIFTALLWRATYKLAQDATGTSNRQAREMAESLRIAQESAQAAKDAAQAAKDQVALATTPRLYIDHVRAENFTVGKQPVFFIKMMNSGPVAAEQVSINIRVEPDSRWTGAKYTDGNNVIFIPANGYREYFITGTHTLTADHINGFNREAWQLKVTGHFEHEGVRTDYAYNYYPFDGDRPAGVPQFLPSDFHTRRTILTSLAGTIRATSALVTGSLTDEKKASPSP